MIDMLNDTRFTYSDERDTAKWTWRGSPAPRSEACGGWRPWVEVFVTAAELIDDLSAAFRSGRLADALAAYTHPAVLVGDEVGYLTYGTDAANMLFHVVNDRHRKKRSTIFTTNKPLNAWGRVLHDDDLASAIIDRVLERGRLLTLDGPSMRTKHLGLDDPTSSEALAPLIRISGSHPPEFPGPTTWHLRSSGLRPSEAPSDPMAIVPRATPM